MREEPKGPSKGKASRANRRPHAKNMSAKEVGNTKSYGKDIDRQISCQL